MARSEEWKTELTAAADEANASTDLNKPRWVHDKAEDTTYFGGFKRLPSCVCSNCGYHTNREKPVCPRCRAKMK